MTLLNNQRLCSLCLNVAKRSVTNAATNRSHSHSYTKKYMRAWTISSFGTLDNLKLSESTSVPFIKHHKDVIVKVCASSVNPLDVEMLGGYGNVVLSTMRQCDNFYNGIYDPLPFTLVPGRDFAGEVVAKGDDVSSDIKIGDYVYGVVPPYQSGCHAEMVVARDSLIRVIPKGIPIAEAASLLFCGLTAWSALNITGDLFWCNKKGKRALVIGGAGGVGSLAVQLLKAWDLEVVATCKNDAIPLLEKLGADIIIDYQAADAMKNLELAGKYDIILDAAGRVTHYTYIPFLKDWVNSKYITLRSPLLSNTDHLGLVIGMIKNATDLARSNYVSGAPKKGSTIRWGYFIPMESGVDELHSLLTQNKIRPVVSEILPFDNLPEAYEKVKAGHNRGKVVLKTDDVDT